MAWCVKLCSMHAKILWENTWDFLSLCHLRNVTSRCTMIPSLNVTHVERARRRQNPSYLRVGFEHNIENSLASVLVNEKRDEFTAAVPPVYDINGESKRVG